MFQGKSHAAGKDIGGYPARKGDGADQGGDPKSRDAAQALKERLCGMAEFVALSLEQQDQITRPLLNVTWKPCVKPCSQKSASARESKLKEHRAT